MTTTVVGVEKVHMHFVKGDSSKFEIHNYLSPAPARSLRFTTVTTDRSLGFTDEAPGLSKIFVISNRFLRRSLIYQFSLLISNGGVPCLDQ